MAASGEHAKYDWIVKADADAVFLSQKLVERVYFMPVEDVRYGFSGNLEVISKTPFSILLANIDICDKKTVNNWKDGFVE